MAEKPVYSKSYKGYVLLILTGVYTFNFIDRQILVILQESIKAELGLSDTELGLLTGLSFALFYVTLGIPIARLSDRSNRRNIVAASLAIWSVMTAVSGLVANYMQLLLARIGVGIGEAGGSPPSHAMISDYFPPEKRATALSIYSTGIYFGILIGYLGGGWIDQHYGWRMAFFMLGIPGVLYALLLLFTVKEPPKGLSDKEHNTVESTDSFIQVFKNLFGIKTFSLMAIGSGLFAFGNYGIGNFFAPFLARVHEMEIASIGLWLGITVGFGGIIGTFSGGWLADRLSHKNIKWYFWVPLIASLINIPLSLGLFFLNDTTIVLILYFFVALLTAMFLGPCIAVSHNLVNAKMRAQASAILFLILNLIGLGLGPLAIGFVSDLLTPTYGVESLRWAFCITFITNATGIILFYMAAKNYQRDLEIKKETNKINLL